MYIFFIIDYQQWDIKNFKIAEFSVGGTFKAPNQIRLELWKLTGMVWNCLGNWENLLTARKIESF